MKKTVRQQSGFTLVELVIIIVVLGILAAVAIPKYQNIAGEARESSCRAALGSLRSGIAIWYANQALQSPNPGWPPLDTVAAVGAVMEQTVPANPFQPNAPDSVVDGSSLARGTVSGTRGGWVYKQATGEIWPNTNVMNENTW